MLLLAYVDGIGPSGDDEGEVLTIIEQLKEGFETGGLGRCRVPLRNGNPMKRRSGTTHVTHDAYARAVLDMSEMARPAKTPAEAGTMFIEEEVLSPEDMMVFRSATASLYIGTHIVLVRTSSLSKPDPRAKTKLKRVLRYMKGTTSIRTTHRTVKLPNMEINYQLMWAPITKATKTRHTLLVRP